jgi:hypothetical protein
MSDRDRIDEALSVAYQFGGIDSEDHKQWVIDQMVRALTGCTLEARGVDAVESPEYQQWVRDAKSGENGPDTYTWEEGIAP